MRIPFSLVFLLFVLAEIALFIMVGGAIGVLATLGLVLFGMIAGVLLLRWHGVAALSRARAEMEAGRPPTRQLAQGAALAAAALLIILPGFLTDLIGVLLFVPQVRGALSDWVRRRVPVTTKTTQSRPRPASGPVVELDQSEYDAPPRPDSPWRQDRESGA